MMLTVINMDTVVQLYVILCTVMKVFATKLLFCMQNYVQCAVKFVKAVPITCNHPKIGIINPGFPLATIVPCPSSHCCATI